MTYRLTSHLRLQPFKRAIWYVHRVEHVGWKCHIMPQNINETWYDKPLKSITVLVWRMHPHADTVGVEIRKGYGDDHTVFEPITFWAYNLTEARALLANHGIKCTAEDFE